MTTTQSPRNKGGIHYIANLFDTLTSRDLPPAEALIQAYHWIKRYAEVEPHRFAVIKIGGESIDPQRGISPAFVNDMGIFSRLQLFPPIIYGWGTALTERLRAHGIDSQFDTKTGDRVTLKEQEMAEVTNISEEFGTSIVRTLVEHQIPAKLITNAFLGQLILFDQYGQGHYTSRVTGVNISKIVAAIAQGFVPVVSPLTVHETKGYFMNTNADSAASELTCKLAPHKFIYLTEVGCVKDLSQQRIPRIILTRDYEKLCSDGTLKGGMRKKVDTIKHTLEVLAETGGITVAQIASPANLSVEVFTDQGAGTYVTLR